MAGSRKRAGSTPRKTPKKPRAQKNKSKDQAQAGKTVQLPGGAAEISFHLNGMFSNK